MFEMRAKMITVGLLGAAVMLPVDLAKADQLGHASWYSLPANITANGERMDPNELTAAHRSLPFGTRVLVENLSNGRSVVVRINDRGPFIGGRIIDLSKAAAASIGMIDAGTAKVRVTTADRRQRTRRARPSHCQSQGRCLFDRHGQGRYRCAETPRKATAEAKSSKGKQVAAKASSRLTHIAKKPDAQAKVRVASASKRSHVAKSKARMSAWRCLQQGHPRRRRAGLAPANQAGDRGGGAHPYAFLGTTPGFMKPDRARTRRAG